VDVEVSERHFSAPNPQKGYLVHVCKSTEGPLTLCGNPEPPFRRLAVTQHVESICIPNF
jgi:hypothetical protein